MDGTKKRLLITGSTFPRWQGDTEPRFVLDLAKEMTKYFDVTVVVPAAIGAKDDEIIEGVRYTVIIIYQLKNGKHWLILEQLFLE